MCCPIFPVAVPLATACRLACQTMRRTPLRRATPCRWLGAWSRSWSRDSGACGALVLLLGANKKGAFAPFRVASAPFQSFHVLLVPVCVAQPSTRIHYLQVLEYIVSYYTRYMYYSI